MVVRACVRALCVLVRSENCSHWLSIRARGGTFPCGTCIPRTMPECIVTSSEGDKARREEGRGAWWRTRRADRSGEGEWRGSVPFTRSAKFAVKSKKAITGYQGLLFSSSPMRAGKHRGRGGRVCAGARLELDNPGLERRMGGERAEGGDSHPWLEGTGYGGVRYGAGGPGYSCVGQRGLPPDAPCW